MAEEEEAPKKGGNFLTKKVGPIPMWGWIAAAGVGVAVFLYRKKAASAISATGATGTATGTTTNAPDVFGASGYSGGQNVGGADSSSSDSFLQQLQNQLGTIQQGVALNPQGVGQVQGVVSTTPAPINVPTASGAPVTAANPTAAIIESQYQSELGRASDPQGAAYWQNVYLTQGPTAEAQQFAASAKKEKPA